MLTKSKLIGVKMTSKMFSELNDLAEKDEITVQELIRKICKRVIIIANR